MHDLLTPDELAAIAEREAKAMKGPWYWRCGAKHPTTLYGSRTNIVMDTTSMRGATLRFWVKGVMHKASDFFAPRKGQEHNASFMSDLDHPDAQFIAHARADIPALLRHIAALEARLDAQPAPNEWLSEGCFPAEPFPVQPGPDFKPTRDILAVLPAPESRRIQRGDYEELIVRAQKLLRTMPREASDLIDDMVRALQQPAPADDPEMDGTDFAHLAWWRGHHQTTEMFCHHVQAILDGHDVKDESVSPEPWHAIRKRLLALVEKPAPALPAALAALLADAGYKAVLAALRQEAVDKCGGGFGAPDLNADYQLSLSLLVREVYQILNIEQHIDALATALRETLAREQAERARAEKATEQWLDADAEAGRFLVRAEKAQADLAAARKELAELGEVELEGRWTQHHYWEPENGRKMPMRRAIRRVLEGGAQ